ncbi:MAG: DinB family protein [Actinobacteria bacterium]|nr:DinB family protein [Actinomycetota bacterium]
MKIESPAFTEETYDMVVGGYFERERAQLLSRLRAIIEETEAVVPELEGREHPIGEDWTPVETLAHIAQAAQFFGWLIHQVASKSEVPPNLLDLLNLRDPAMVESSKLEPAELAGQARTALERTIGFLQTVPYDDLRTPFTFGTRQLTAEDVARISVAHHLEDHLEQLRAGLAG